MNYDLAKKLAKAGFPHGICEWTDEHPDRDSNEHVPIPTLEELIEACGVRFHSLLRIADRWHAYENRHSEANIGSTPLEAVANLWLALNPITN